MVKGDIIIDDGLHNMYGNHKYKLLLDKPWNRNSERNVKLSINEIMEAFNITRVNNWQEIIPVINEIKK
jgi:5'(3')-deoxyribonucleotidase